MTTKIASARDRELAVASQAITEKGKERGMLGDIFGTREHAPTNIAGAAVFVLALIIVGLIFLPLPPEVPRSGLITAFLSALTFTLGLLFGNRSSGDKDS